MRLISEKLDDDCGCVEQEWDSYAGSISTHLKPDGTAEVHFNNGDDGEWEISIEFSNKDEFNSKLGSYVDSLPVIDR